MGKSYVMSLMLNSAVDLEHVCIVDNINMNLGHSEALELLILLAQLH